MFAQHITMSMSAYDIYSGAMSTPLSSLRDAAVGFLKSIQSNPEFLSLTQKLYNVYNPNVSTSVSPFEMIEEMINALNTTGFEGETGQTMLQEITVEDLKGTFGSSMNGGKRKSMRNRNRRRSTRKQYGGNKKRIMLLIFALMMVLSAALASQPTCVDEIGGSCKPAATPKPACKTWAQIAWDYPKVSNNSPIAALANGLSAFAILSEAIMKISKCGWSWT
jgi:hypothetical protein